MAVINPDEISSILKENIRNYEAKAEVSNVGSVLEVGDGICRIYGLRNVMSNELVEFEIAVRTIPQFDVENPKMISQGPSVCIFNKEDPQEVLASWLFVQYLVSKDVQLAYSATEGYVPVTSQAQTSEEYLDYLSRVGEDNDRYYSVKLEASRLLLDNTENTFITPVFNGSASLRNAAGQMIEETVKAIRRKKTVDDKFLKDLKSNMISLYKLDEITAGNKSDLGPLPTGSIILLSSLGIIWLGIGTYFAVNTVKSRKNSKKF